MERLQGQQCNYIIECFSFKFCGTQIKVITTVNRERKIFIRSRSELKEKTSELRLARETRVTKLRLVLVLGRESGASFIGQSERSYAKPQQSRFTLDTQWKIAHKPFQRVLQ